MKKLIVVLFILCFAAPGFADSDKYNKGYTSQVYSSKAQVFIQNVVLYGFDIRTDGINSVEIQLYDTGAYAQWARDSNVDNKDRSTASGSKIGPKYFITSSSTDRTQVHEFPTAVQTTNGGVYMDITTNSTSFEIEFYYNLSNLP